MPFLTVDGVTIPVQSGNAVRQEDHRQGQVRYSHDGTLLSSLRTPKKIWQFSTRPLKLDEIGTIRSVLSGFLAKTVSGTGIDGSISALVLVTNQPYLQDGLTHQQIIDITIMEI